MTPRNQPPGERAVSTPRPNPWPMVKFREFLRPNSRPYTLGPEEDANLVGMRLYGAGPFHRELKPALRIAKKSHFVIKAGDVIFNKLFAWKGTFGIVPPELDDMFVSDKFPTYELDREKVDERFLRWYFRCPQLWDEAKAMSTGSAALSKLTLNPPKFLLLTMPLPPLAEQRRVVARIEDLAAQIHEACTLRQQTAAEAEAFVTSVHANLSGNRTKKLGEIVVLDEDAVPVEATGSYRQVGVRSFGGGLFPKGAVEGTGTTYRSFNCLYDGALLLSQVKGWEGAIAVCPHELAGWFVSPEYRTFRCIPSEACPRYLASLVRTEWFWRKLATATRGVGARRERTRPEQFLNIELPMPDVKQQKRGEVLFAEVDALARLQAETAAELDALLPALLDRAFQGQL